MSTPEPRALDTPAVGIFWRVDRVLVMDRTLLSHAESYGDCLTHGPGHYERWEAWQRLGVRRLRELGHPERIADTEYDDWPRGRVVYEVPLKRFVLYADRRLQHPAVVQALREAFGLVEAEVIVRGDSHYR